MVDSAQAGKGYAIYLLGQPEIRRDMQPCKVTRRICRGIVFYLAAHLNAVNREVLQEMFWPDIPSQTSSHNLSQHMSEISKQAPGLIIKNGSYYSLEEGTVVDTRLFDAYFSSSTLVDIPLREALRSYRGDFLDGFSLDVSPEFNDWYMFCLERYRALYAHGLIESARQHRFEGEPSKAFAELRSAINVDPFAEEPYRELMILWYEQGDLLNVGRAYRKLEEALVLEFDASPSRETQHLFESIMDGSAGLSARLDLRRPVQPLSFSASQKTTLQGFPFIGRESEMAFLNERREWGGMLLVSGLSGTGKTRLLSEYVKAWDGIALHCSCDDLPVPIPLLPIVSALRGFFAEPQWLGLKQQIKRNLHPLFWNEMRALTPEIDNDDLNATASLSDEYHRMQAIQQLLVEISRHYRLMIAVDDLHYIDSSTLSLLSLIALSNKDYGITLVTTEDVFVSAPGVARVKDYLMASGNLHVLSLSVLPRSCVKPFSDLIDKDNATLEQWLFDYTKANPCVLVETTKYIIELQKATDLQSIMSSFKIVPTFKSIIATKYNTLFVNTRKVVDAAAVCGDGFSLAMLAFVSELTWESVLEGIDELVTKGYIYETEDNRYWFIQSNVTRETTYELISSQRRDWLEARKHEYLTSE
jgi:DNA-binding SARP family transcriptional activator